MPSAAPITNRTGTACGQFNYNGVDVKIFGAPTAGEEFGKIDEIDGEGRERWNGILEPRSKLEDRQTKAVEIFNRCSDDWRCRLPHRFIGRDLQRP
jgi:hypothetical protein